MFEYTKDLVIAKVKKIFPNENKKQVAAILDSYGGKEDIRVQIAILKLSNGDLEELRELVDTANKDYRDVLAWAEYPEEMKNDTWKMNVEEASEIRRKDRQQFTDWLED